LIWTVHGLIYRWRATAVRNGAIEDFLGRLGDAIRTAFARAGRGGGAN
jgi:hypothetical protein